MSDKLLKEEVRQCEVLLKQKRAELTELLLNSESAAETVQLDQTLFGRVSRVDALQQQSMSKASRQQYEIGLIKIEQALKRIEEGEYGYCLECDEQINPKRLLAHPESSYCIECQDDIG